MFSCGACLRRALQTLVYDFGGSGISTGRISAHGRRQRVAHHSTVESIRKGHHRRLLMEALRSKNSIPVPASDRRRGHLSPGAKSDLIARGNNKAHLEIAPGGNRTSSVTNSENFDYQIQFLKDPLKLATAVLTRLRNADVEGALNLVRASEKEKLENVVSWNHVMDYQMSVKKTRAALSTYNEMKKRGHRPDAHTYTIMLRGFTQNIDQPQAVQSALSIYNSMSAPNSAVSPNIIHTNAIINACARGRDMDAIWSVAGRLPERGSGAPDKWTFTTILNALAATAQANARSLSKADGGEDAAKNALDQAVSEGRKLWEDIVARWRAGDLMIDQPLVCAMGRLLLLGSTSRDWTDVFGLIEQTMQIPRQTPSTSQPSTEVRLANEATNATTKSLAASNEFAPVELLVTQPRSSQNRATASSLYAVPGNNTLSLLLTTSIILKSAATGKSYWDLLTGADGPYNVQPDADNYHSYMRLLRISRSSRMVRDLLREQIPAHLEKEYFRRGTFVLAMSTCVRDKNNPNTFDYASNVVDIMQDKLEKPDPRVLEMYLSLAIVTTPGLSHLMPGATFCPVPWKNNAMRALGRLGPHALNVRTLIKDKIAEEEYGGAGARVMEERSRRQKGVKEKMMRPRWLAQKQESRDTVEDLAGFLQALISTYDKLLTQRKHLPKQYIDDCEVQKKKLNKFVTKMVGGQQRQVESRLREVQGEIREDDGQVKADTIQDRKTTKREKEATKLRSQFPANVKVDDDQEEEELEQQYQPRPRRSGLVQPGWGDQWDQGDAKQSWVATRGIGSMATL